MKDKDFRARLASVTPEVPEAFHEAMQKTLGGIVAQEWNAPAKPLKTGRISRRALVLALLITLALATVAAAAIHWRVFDYIFGYTPTNIGEMMYNNLHSETINNVEITVQEAGYDGMSLYLSYRYRMLDVEQAFPDDGGIGQEALELLGQHGVGWWIDHIWFNGKCMDMPAGSGGTTTGTGRPGEIQEYQIWTLYKEGVFLEDGATEISLPIGERQPLDEYYIREHPEKYGEDGLMLLPEKGMVTLTLDSSIRERVVTTRPNLKTELPTHTAWVAEAVYTPLMMYVTLGWEVKPEAFDAYIAENGEGVYDEAGNLFWPYSQWDVIEGWCFSLELVDRDGKPVFGEDRGLRYGVQGGGEYYFPYMEKYPEEMYLAPMGEGFADMTQAVRLK